MLEEFAVFDRGLGGKDEGSEVVVRGEVASENKDAAGIRFESGQLGGIEGPGEVGMMPGGEPGTRAPGALFLIGSGAACGYKD